MRTFQFHSRGVNYIVEIYTHSDTTSEQRSLTMEVTLETVYTSREELRAVPASRAHPPKSMDEVVSLYVYISDVDVVDMYTYMMRM